MTQHSTLIAHTNGSGRGGTSSRKKAAISSLEQELQNLNPTIPIEIKAVFTPEMFCVSAAQAFSSYMDMCHNAQDDIRMTARTITVFLYGLKRDMSRNAFKFGTGKRHANFRFKIAKIVLRNALLLTDEAFKEQEERIIADAMRNSQNGSETSATMEPSARKPEWLQAQYLTGRVLDLARRYHECVRSEVGSVPTDIQKRKYLTVCRYVVKTTNDLLRVSRDRSRQKMFEAGLFLLTDWTKRSAFGEGHCKPLIRFIHPSAVTCNPGDIQNCVTTADENYHTVNAGLLSRLISERKEMQIEATYNVTVVMRSNARRRDREPVTEIREICRDFNIIRIALVFFEAYAQCKEGFLLSAHTSMLRNVYRLALLIRDFCIDNVEEGCRPFRSSICDAVQHAARPKTQTTRSAHTSAHGDDDCDEFKLTGNQTYCEQHDRNVSQSEGSVKTMEVTLKELLPGEAESDKEIMKVLKISADAYEKLSVKENANVGRDDVENVDEGEHDFSDVDSDGDDLVGMIDT